MIVLIRDLRPKSRLGMDRAERRAQAPARRPTPSAARSRSASARRSCAISASATWCCCRTRRPRATSAWRRSACASSASARSGEAMAGRAQHTSEPLPGAGAEGARVLLIEAPYYEAIAEALAAGAIAELEAAGATFERVAVPGALEIPLALAQAVQAGLIPGDAAARPLRRLRGARLRHPRRDHALRDGVRQRQPLADGHRRAPRHPARQRHPHRGDRGPGPGARAGRPPRQGRRGGARLPGADRACPRFRGRARARHEPSLAEARPETGAGAQPGAAGRRAGALPDGYRRDRPRRGDRRVQDAPARAATPRTAPSPAPTPSISPASSTAWCGASARSTR